MEHIEYTKHTLLLRDSEYRALMKLVKNRCCAKHRLTPEEMSELQDIEIMSKPAEDID